LAGNRAVAWIDRTTPTRYRAKAGWQRVPERLRKNVVEQFFEQVGKFKPIVDSGRIIGQAGLLALALYALAYAGLAWLDMSGSFYRAQLGPGYLFRAITWTLGPHDIAFWTAFTEPIALLSHMIVEPLRICLVACTLAYCVERSAADDAAPPTAADEAESSRPAS
jgi:hypothetical protein